MSLSIRRTRRRWNIRKGKMKTKRRKRCMRWRIKRNKENRKSKRRMIIRCKQKLE